MIKHENMQCVFVVQPHIRPPIPHSVVTKLGCTVLPIARALLIIRVGGDGDQLHTPLSDTQHSAEHLFVNYPVAEISKYMRCKT